MGRSARQRRLKSVDPFNPLRGRILAAERKDPTKNLPVDEKRDEKKIPRKLREIMHGQKKLAEIEAKRKAKKHSNAQQGSGPTKKAPAAAKPKSTTTTPVASGASVPANGVTTSTEVHKKKVEPKFEGMRPGESFQTFNQRIRKEAHDMLIEESKKNSRQLEKRKEYRTKRKEKESKKRKRSELSDDDDDGEGGYENRVGVDSDDEGATTAKRGPQRTVTHFAQLKDDVKFGEQVEAPPKLARLPRGATPAAKKAKTPTLAAAMLQNPMNAAEKRAMDLMRERIRNQMTSKQPIAKLTTQPINGKG